MNRPLASKLDLGRNGGIFGSLPLHPMVWYECTDAVVLLQKNYRISSLFSTKIQNLSTHVDILLFSRKFGWRRQVRYWLPRREKRQKIGRKKLSHLPKSDVIRKGKTRVFRETSLNVWSGLGAGGFSLGRRQELRSSNVANVLLLQEEERYWAVQAGGQQRQNSVMTFCQICHCPPARRFRAPARAVQAAIFTYCE